MSCRQRRASPTTGMSTLTFLEMRGGIDVDVDDLGLGGEEFEVAGDAVVEACADGDEAVGFLDGVVGVGRAVHAQHVQAAGIVLVEGAQAQQGGGAGEIGLVGELADFLPGVGEDRAAADVEHGAFGGVDHLRRGLGHLGMAQHARLVAGQIGRVVDRFFDLGRWSHPPGRSTSTGPGRPVVAMMKASLMMRGRSLTSLTR